MADSADSADRLIADALHLAGSLEAFTTLDWAERIAPPVQQGNQALAQLRRRRESLTGSRWDDAIIAFAIASERGWTNCPFLWLGLGAE